MPENILTTLGLVVFTMALSGGQLLFKQAGLAIRGRPALQGLLLLSQLPMLYTALALYGFATLLWIWILSRVPLARAYPWVAAGTVIVPLLALHVFGERVGPLFWLGAALIVCGILITQAA